ncbi:dynein axonemal heavy chain 6-like [Clarias gariepinus]
MSHTPSPPVPDPQRFSSVEDVIRAGILSPYEIVQIIRRNPDLGFFYMMPADSKSSYDLRLVPYAALNKTNYYTISAHGVTHYSNDVVDFVPLERWEQEYLLYQQLLLIPTFALFRQRKAFCRWRSSVRYKTVSLCKRSLDNSLFFMNESLRPALISIREMCYRIQDVHLCRIEKQRTYTLEEFQCAQYAQLREVSQRLVEFRELVKEVAVTACYTALLEKGFRPDHGKDGDENKPCADLETLYEETPDKTSYSEQFNKKQECSRLTCFIRLADYLIMSTLHKLTVYSISKLLSELQEHLTHTPSHTLIQSWASVMPTQDTGDKDSVSEQNAEASVLPLFITELMMDTHELSFQPSIKDFQEVISEIVSRVQKTVLCLEPLVLDSDFDAFTRPVIHNKTKEKTCGHGPDLQATLGNDQQLQNIIRGIKKSIQVAFDAADTYAHTFTPFHLFYKENESLDLDALKEQDHGRASGAL